jgi:hypothetical protein
MSFRSIALLLNLAFSNSNKAASHQIPAVEIFAELGKK